MGINTCDQEEGGQAGRGEWGGGVLAIMAMGELKRDLGYENERLIKKHWLRLLNVSLTLNVREACWRK